MKKKTLSYTVIILGVSFLILLLWITDPFYEWKLNSAKQKYGIELPPKNVEWINEDYRSDTERRSYYIVDVKGRYERYIEEYYGNAKNKRNDLAFQVRYGWVCDSLVYPVELVATYTFKNGLFRLELKDTTFQKNYVHYLDKRASLSGSDAIEIRPIAYDEFMVYSEFLKLKSSWGKGERIWIYPMERFFNTK